MDSPQRSERRDVRFPLHLPVLVRMAQRKEMHTRSENISLGGILRVELFSDPRGLGGGGIDWSGALARSGHSAERSRQGSSGEAQGHWRLRGGHPAGWGVQASTLRNRIRFELKRREPARPESTADRNQLIRWNESCACLAYRNLSRLVSGRSARACVEKGTRFRRTLPSPGPCPRRMKNGGRPTRQDRSSSARIIQETPQKAATYRCKPIAL